MFYILFLISLFMAIFCFYIARNTDEGSRKIRAYIGFVANMFAAITSGIFIYIDLFV